MRALLSGLYIGGDHEGGRGGGGGQAKEGKKMCRCSFGYSVYDDGHVM